MMSRIQRLGIEQTYSQSVVHGGTVYLSGQVPWQTSEKGLAIADQVQECLDEIDNQLAAAGSSKTRLLNLQIFLQRPEDYAVMNTVFMKWLPDGYAPARNTICGVCFPNPKWLCEFVVTAALNNQT